MDSKELVTLGFEGWLTFAENKEFDFPETPGTYVVTSLVPFGRLRGETDILYIGSTKSVMGRFRRYSRPQVSQATETRVNYYLKKIGPFKIGYKLFTNTFDAILSEADLLRIFENDHFDLPPLNRQSSVFNNYEH